MEAPEVAMYLIKYLKASAATSERVHRQNFLNPGGEVDVYAGQDLVGRVRQRLNEAWVWLRYELCLAPDTGQTGEWEVVTDRGRDLADNPSAVETFRAAKYLPFGSLLPILEAEVRPLFVRGEYELAVLAAMRSVEIEVRRASDAAQDKIGYDLMTEAFKPHQGPLQNRDAPEAEQLRLRELFTGAIGYFKNPASHRRVTYADPIEVADIIRLADLMLRIVRSPAPSVETDGNEMTH